MVNTKKQGGKKKSKNRDVNHIGSSLLAEQGCTPEPSCKKDTGLRSKSRSVVKVGHICTSPKKLVENKWKYVIYIYIYDIYIYMIYMIYIYDIYNYYMINQSVKTVP